MLKAFMKPKVLVRLLAYGGLGGVSLRLRSLYHGIFFIKIPNVNRREKANFAEVCPFFADKCRHYERVRFLRKNANRRRMQDFSSEKFNLYAFFFGGVLID